VQEGIPVRNVLFSFFFVVILFNKYKPSDPRRGRTEDGLSPPTPEGGERMVQAPRPPKGERGWFKPPDPRRGREDGLFVIHCSLSGIIRFPKKGIYLFPKRNISFPEKEYSFSRKGIYLFLKRNIPFC
jgi:hypothetical protein